MLTCGLHLWFGPLQHLPYSCWTFVPARTATQLRLRLPGRFDYTVRWTRCLPVSYCLSLATLPALPGGCCPIALPSADLPRPLPLPRDAAFTVLIYTYARFLDDAAAALAGGQLIIHALPWLVRLTWRPCT